MTEQRFTMTPARWATVAVGAPVMLALIGWTGLNAVAAVGQGSFPVSASFPVSDGVLHVGVGGGNVTARPVATDIARLTGVVHYSLIKPHLRYTRTGVNFNCPLPVGNCGVDGTLGVPPGDALDMSTDGGNLTVADFTSAVTLNSGGGDLAAQNLTGDLRMNTAGGNIQGEDLADRHVTVRTGGGDVTLTFVQAPQALDVGTGGGNITVILPRNSAGYELRTSTGGGNVTVSPDVQINSGSPDVVTLTSGGGDITVTEASAS